MRATILCYAQINFLANIFIRAQLEYDEASFKKNMKTSSSNKSQNEPRLSPTRPSRYDDYNDSSMMRLLMPEILETSNAMSFTLLDGERFNEAHVHVYEQNMEFLVNVSVTPWIAELHYDSTRLPSVCSACSI